MAEKWICPNCREDVPDSHGECWNCQSARPGFVSHADQMAQNAEMQAEMMRQLGVADEIQKLELSNQERLSKLLDRWEKLTDRFQHNPNA